MRKLQKPSKNLLILVFLWVKILAVHQLSDFQRKICTVNFVLEQYKRIIL